MIYFERTVENGSLNSQDMRAGLQEALKKAGDRKSVLVIPPDHTRSASRAGELTGMAYDFYGKKLKTILPALGTHVPMTADEKAHMFGNIPAAIFRDHDFRKDVIKLGEVPADFVSEVSEGVLSFAWPAQANRILVEGGYDLILSIGQIVPHEVAGMAGYTKNILVGTGGKEGIDLSHYLGAVYGMERMMGRIDTPVRRVFQYAEKHFLKKLPIIYVLTVISTDGKRVQGLFIGDDEECFRRAAALSQKVNITILDEPLTKAVVYCSPAEYKSTWLANKSIYRTRMAMADGAELIIMAPGLERFGESQVGDRLVRRHGYCGTAAVLRKVKEDPELAGSLGIAAHLIHGSTEGRFRVVYAPGAMKRAEIEGAGYQYGVLEECMKRYDPAKCKDGWNSGADGDRFYFISNPGLGLWATKERDG